MKPSLGKIKSDDGLGRDFTFKKGKKKREKKEKLLKREYGFGYGLTYGLSMLFSPFVENKIFFFFFFF